MPAARFHRLDGGEKVSEAHQGMLTCIRDPYSESLISGGEDGKVLRIGADACVTEVASAPRKWISQLAAGLQGAIAFSYGKSASSASSDGDDQGIYRRANRRRPRLRTQEAADCRRAL